MAQKNKLWARVYGPQTMAYIVYYLLQTFRLLLVVANIIYTRTGITKLSIPYQNGHGLRSYLYWWTAWHGTDEILNRPGNKAY